MFLQLSSLPHPALDNVNATNVTAAVLFNHVLIKLMSVCSKTLKSIAIIMASQLATYLYSYILQELM